MKLKLTTPLIAAIGALVLVSTLFLSFYLSTSAYRSDGTGIVLPSELDTEPVVTQGDEELPRALQQIEITVENVQDVIRTLERPSAYSFEASSTVYYDSKQYTVTCRQSVFGAICRTDELSTSDTPVRTMLRVGDTLYSWKNGSTQYYTGKNGDFPDDSAAMLPTYETVLELPQEILTEAGLVNLDYQPCIYVGIHQQEYHSIYYVSTISGMLVRADFYKGEELVRQCLIRKYSADIPEAGLFHLPDGTVPDGSNLQD